jgi:hypothetical protein
MRLRRARSRWRGSPRLCTTVKPGRLEILGNPPVKTAVQRRRVRLLVSAIMPPLCDAPSGGPVPRQEFVQPVDGVIGDAGEHIGEPGLRVHVVELCRRDHRRHDGGTVSATLGQTDPNGAAYSRSVRRPRTRSRGENAARATTLPAPPQEARSVPCASADAVRRFGR